MAAGIVLHEMPRSGKDPVEQLLAKRDPEAERLELIQLMERLDYDSKGLALRLKLERTTVDRWVSGETREFPYAVLELLRLWAERKRAPKPKKK